MSVWLFVAALVLLFLAQLLVIVSLRRRRKTDLSLSGDSGGESRSGGDVRTGSEFRAGPESRDGIDARSRPDRDPAGAPSGPRREVPPGKAPCPHCGTLNDTSYQFCRECTAELG